MMSLLVVAFMFSTPALPQRAPVRRYITLTLQVPASMSTSDAIELIRMIDDVPHQGVYVIDVNDRREQRPKRARRPKYLPKLPEDAR